MDVDGRFVWFAFRAELSASRANPLAGYLLPYDTTLRSLQWISKLWILVDPIQYTFSGVLSSLEYCGV